MERNSQFMSLPKSMVDALQKEYLMYLFKYNILKNELYK